MNEDNPHYEHLTSFELERNALADIQHKNTSRLSLMSKRMQLVNSFSSRSLTTPANNFSLTEDCLIINFNSFTTNYSSSGTVVEILKSVIFAKNFKKIKKLKQ